MLRRELFTHLRPSVCTRGTTRSYIMRESTYRPKPSKRRSYANRSSAVRSTGKNAGITRSEVMTVETPHLAGIGIAGAASTYSICALWSDVDETRRAKIIELIESEDLRS